MRVCGLRSCLSCIVYVQDVNGFLAPPFHSLTLPIFHLPSITTHLIQPSSYFHVKLSIFGGNSNHTEWDLNDIGEVLRFSIKFEGFGMRITEVTVRVVLCTLTVVFLVYWIYQNYRRRVAFKDWLQERRWITALLCVMILWQDPIFMYAQLNYRPGHDILYTISSICEDSAAVFMLFFWLLLLSAIRRRQSSRLRFYLPKVLFAVVTLAAFVVNDVARLMLVGSEEPPFSVQDLLFWGNIAMLSMLAWW